MNKPIFKAGDEVECLVYGNGVVSEIGKYGDVRVYFDEILKAEWYNEHGRIAGTKNRTLYGRGTVKVVEVGLGCVPNFSTSKERTATLADGTIAKDGGKISHPKTADGVSSINVGQWLYHPDYGKGMPTYETVLFPNERLIHINDCYLRPCARTADGVVKTECERVYHPDYGKGAVTLAPDGEGVFAAFIGGDVCQGDFATAEVGECYSKPCARLAGGSVIMDAEICTHPVYGRAAALWKNDKMVANVYALDEYQPIDHCYPLGSRVVTPAEMDAQNNEICILKKYLEVRQNQFERAIDQRDEWRNKFNSMRDERAKWKSEANRQREIVLKMIDGEEENAHS